MDWSLHVTSPCSLKSTVCMQAHSTDTSHLGTTWSTDLTGPAVTLLHFHDCAWARLSIKTVLERCSLLIRHMSSFFFQLHFQSFRKAHLLLMMLGRYCQRPIKLDNLAHKTASMLKILDTFNLRSFLMHGNIPFFPSERHSSKCWFQTFQSVLAFSRTSTTDVPFH